MKVLFVCLGNICRSPLAEAIFKHKTNKMELSGIFLADSCGTANYHVGNSPDPRTIKNAFKNSVEIVHVGRQFAKKDFTEYDWIFAMDKSNLDVVLSLAESAIERSKVKLIRDFDPIGVGDVPDPYYGAEADFQNVFSILDRTIDNLIVNLTKRS
jgi:protein-tyrosine phosphatase